MARRNQRSVSESIVVLSGRPRYLGTISFTNSIKTNNDTTAFNNTGNALLGKTLLLQADQDVYIMATATTAGVDDLGNTLSAANGVKIFANERVILAMDDIDVTTSAGNEKVKWLATLRVSADGSLKVWELV